MSCRVSFPSSAASVAGHVYPAPRSPSALAGRVPAPLRQQPVYAYIVTTIATTPAPHFNLVQDGSGPNFDGGRITLCTCKHKDRATFYPSRNRVQPWDGVWVAGLTSRSATPSRTLAYLMLVEDAFPDQNALWHGLPAACRREKSAVRSVIGDLYEPLPAAHANPHDPRNYRPPIAGHAHAPKRHPHMWHHDIMQWSSRTFPHGRSHLLLLGDAQFSYRWVRSVLRLNPNLVPPAMKPTAHHRVFATLDDFIAALV